jgi:TRAP-type C4-dicarboxylate transport system substrate-binding protein
VKRLCAPSCLIAALLVLAATARGEPVTLRMAAIAPEGTEWARSMKAFATEIENTTKGELRVKWYLGGIAGDEMAALERIRHGQLDGAAGASFCAKLAPSLRAVRLAGLYQSRDEVIHVMGRLKPVLDDEMRKAGFFNLGEAVFGVDILFSRQPIRTMAELKATRLWAWTLDPVWQSTLNQLGIHHVVSTLEEHSPAWRKKAYDAYFTVPSVALAYQWSTEASYVADLRATVLPACLVVSNAALDPLPLEHKQAVITTAAKFMNRFNEVSARLDEALLDGLLEKQGLKKVPVSPEFRAQFVAATKEARDKLGAALIAPSLLASVEKMLSEYRERREASRR